MDGIRRILNIFTRETERRQAPPLLGDDLVAFIRTATDPHVIDQALQQAGRAPFWPQDQRMMRFYQAALTDRPLAARLKAAADAGVAARRHALAHLHAAPDPVGEAHLPQRRHAVAHIVAIDNADPDNSRSFLRRIRQPQNARIMGNTVIHDVLGAFGGDITAALAADTEPSEALRALLIEQTGDILRDALRAASGGALSARLDAILHRTLSQAAPSCFADLRVEIASAAHFDAHGRAIAMAAAECAAAIVTRLKDAPLEPLFTCRDDRLLMLRGFGDRTRVDNYLLAIDDDLAAQYARLCELLEASAGATNNDSRLIAAADDREQSAGIVMIRADQAAARLADCRHAHEALAEMALFARAYGVEGGNRGLRHYWQRHEDAGLPSRIGALMGLVLGDLQNLYEHLTRRDIYRDAPDVQRLQDRMLARPLPTVSAGIDSNDSA